LIVGATPLPVPASTVAAASKEVSFEAVDRGVVYADWYRRAKERSRLLFLMFHQAGSNAAEYATIAPRVVDLGFDCLAVDTRSGGQKFQRNNRTVMARGGSASFNRAYTDMQAALRWAIDGQGYDGVVAWGSSYTAALVFELAAEHDEVRAVISFSPGEHLGEGEPVRRFASRVHVPVFVASAPGVEVREAARIVEPVPAGLVTQFIPKSGVHGSSALRADVNPQSRADYWRSLEAFVRTALVDGSAPPHAAGVESAEPR
jgi:dienelactone hydrolase